MIKTFFIAREKKPFKSKIVLIRLNVLRTVTNTIIRIVKSQITRGTEGDIRKVPQFPVNGTLLSE